MKQSVVTEEMRSAIGVESAPYGDVIERGRVRLFAEAVGDSNPLYTDEVYARGTKYGGVIAPPTFVCSVDRRRKIVGWKSGAWGGKHYENPYGRSLHASDEWEFFHPVRVGDAITATNKILEFSEKEGKKGPLLFTVVEIEYRNQLGQLVATRRTTGISYP